MSYTIVWKAAEEACANHLQKGSLVVVEGRTQTRNYENNEGRRIYVTEVIAENVLPIATEKWWRPTIR